VPASTKKHPSVVGDYYCIRRHRLNSVSLDGYKCVHLRARPKHRSSLFSKCPCPGKLATLIYPTQIRGIAKGLCYLHNHQPPVFHGDVKGVWILVVLS